MLHDIRVAWRFLRKAPVSTTIAVITLGVTVAICSLAAGILDETLWRPLAVDANRRLVTLYNHRPSAPQFQVLSYPDYADVRDRLHESLAVAAFVRVFQTLTGGESPARVQGEVVSGNYFQVLAARPFIGTLIGPDDEARAVVVLAHDFWRRSLSADPNVIGKVVRLNRQDYTVVGVASPEFHAPAYRSEFWIPVGVSHRVFGRSDLLERADLPLFQTVARLVDDVTIEQVDARVRAIETSASRDGWRLSSWPAAYLKFWPAYRVTVARFVGIFAALGACVLAIACANLAGLLLARAGERQRELSLRQALGATRAQLLRRLLAESAILTALGAIAGVCLAYEAAAFVSNIPVPVPAQIGLTPNVRLIAISIAVALVASLIFTTTFALKGLSADIRSVLASSNAAVVARSGLQRLLVIVQVAVSCVCVSAAGLLVRSALAVDGVDVGFDAERVVMGQVGLGDQGYTAANGVDFYQRLQADLAEEPGVESVALEWNAALGSIRGTARFATGSDAVQARYNVVSPNYFETLRIPLVAGRTFEWRDSVGGEPVALINETFAARLRGDAIGSLMTMSGEPTSRRIIGIIREVKYNGVTEPPQPFVYLPLAQAFRADAWIHVRTTRPDVDVLLRDRLRHFDPNVALSDVHMLSEQLDRSRAAPRTSARVSAALAAIAVFLALVGVYGLLAASVDQRARELSIRAALGATPRDILASVAFSGLRLTAIGLGLGLLASMAASSLLSTLLYDVQPRDPLVFALVPVAILSVSTFAWLAPARRAASASPLDILRGE